MLNAAAAERQVVILRHCFDRCALRLVCSRQLTQNCLSVMRCLHDGAVCVESAGLYSLLCHKSQGRRFILQNGIQQLQSFILYIVRTFVPLHIHNAIYRPSIAIR